ncbi:hypothetical protein BS47DRAFT_1364251 [Hydnum rufescens UP504]|uniref:Uncharacterized protein n=1 Tax=Hydnum rufescens UP504 TaxID=1448309 RepID=A0A9P6ARX6_9AGAM|nr:hypothetical protein BS47DRAFT_1364251 [Hydnum rufescens UP504]
MAPKEQQKLLFWCCICSFFFTDVPPMQQPAQFAEDCPRARLPKYATHKIQPHTRLSRSIPICNNQPDKNTKKVLHEILMHHHQRSHARGQLPNTCNRCDDRQSMVPHLLWNPMGFAWVFQPHHGFYPMSHGGWEVLNSPVGTLCNSLIGGSTTNRLLLKGTKGFLLDQSHTGTSVDSPPTNITINEKQVWCNWVILWGCRSKRSWSHDQYSKGTDWSENVRDNYNAEFQTNPMSGRPYEMGTYLHVHTL